MDRLIEFIVEINLRSIKVLVTNQQSATATKVDVLYKKKYIAKIVDCKTKQILNFTKIQHWLSHTIFEIEAQLLCKLKTVLIVVCSLGFKLSFIQEISNYSTQKYSYKDNQILLERIKVMRNVKDLSIINIIPLRFEIDNQLSFSHPPINAKINRSIKIKALCYLLNRQFINQIKKLFHQLDLKVKSIVAESFGMAYEQVAIKQLKKRVVMCHFNNEYSNISFNYNEIIWSHQFLKISIKQIIQDINYFFQCGLKRAYDIFKLYGMLSINFEERLNNKVIYKRFFENINRFVVYKVEFLTKVINARILESFEKIIKKAQLWVDVAHAEFIVSGQFLKIHNFQKFIKHHFPNIDFKFYKTQTIGLIKEDFSAILGSLYYWNNHNIINTRLAKRINYNENNIYKALEQLSFL